MNYEDIKSFDDRCASHFGIVNTSMITNVLMDEIEELRDYIEEKEKNDASKN